ncbi:hypothetical protein HYX08_07300 [Candidatus Woesearchaeota archaeon]|nr:hypothetical protein [Candidatus Woesearchaeota archaeon]
MTKQKIIKVLELILLFSITLITLSSTSYANENNSIIILLIYSFEYTTKPIFEYNTTYIFFIIAETDEKNNYIKKAARPATKAYIDIVTDYPVLTSVINNYLDDYIDIVSSGQDVNIYVGRKNSNLPKDLQKTDNKNWKYENNIITYTSKSEGLPYNGLVVKDGTNIYVFGNEIDGDIAALRKLVDNQEFYFSKSVSSRADYISEEDLDGLFVFDYLHTDENQAKYRKNNENFRKVVENVLNSDVTSLSIKRVLTANDNTSLRLKNINAELSVKYKNFSNPRPVVLGHGVFGDLFSLEKLANKIAKDNAFNGKYVRDVWLIEYTGGPNTECSTCPNYDYNTLKTYYWPALLGGVLKYSNKNSVDYVGYSLGGGLALDSYTQYYQGTSNTIGYYLNDSGNWTTFNLSANFVDHMVLLAPMGTFNGTTRFTAIIDRHGNQTKSALSQYNHISQKNISDSINKVCKWYEIDCKLLHLVTQSDGVVSYNLWIDIQNRVINKSDSNPSLTSINKLLLVRSRLGGFSDDGVIPDTDIQSIYQNSNSTKKYKAAIVDIHASMADFPGTYYLISAFLNDVTYSRFDKIVWSIEED